MEGIASELAAEHLAQRDTRMRTAGVIDQGARRSRKCWSLAQRWRDAS